MLRTLLAAVLGLCVLTTVVLFLRVGRIVPEQYAARNLATLQRDEEVPQSVFRHGVSFLQKFALLPRIFLGQRNLVAVVIENHQESRQYQQGLSDALLVQEYFVEGMITRFVALFDADDLPQRVGPVRSLRPYFLDATLPYSSYIIHAGGSPEALERAYADDRITALNALAYDGTLFQRQVDAPAPHDLFTTGEDIVRLLSGVTLRPTVWPPYKTGGVFGAPPAKRIAIDYQSPVHNVTYTYGLWSRTYERMNGSTVTPANPSNIIVLDMRILGTGEYGRLTLETTGEGELLLFRNGTVQRGMYRKESDGSPFQFFDEYGGPLLLAAGQTWVHIVQDVDVVEWEEED